MNKDSKKRLKELFIKESFRKYPSLPDIARGVKLPSDNSTNGLTQCVLKWIQLSGFHAERINNTGRMIDNRKEVANVLGQKGLIGSQKWIKGTGTNGTADISAIVKSIAWKIEIKFGNDRQSEDQKK